ncbi:general substrate transporter [Mycena crocata]|nr:general substrate transporter [Mycena crocata]
MAGAAGPLSTTRRRALAGKSGWAGLVHNRRIFLMAVFASLGGLLYGYNQGVFSGVLGMHSFGNRMGDAVADPDQKGWLVSILELGAWLGVLMTGYFADKISRKYTIVLAVVVFCIGVIVQTTAKAPPSIFGGRFVTGLGVGSLSMAVPLYNSEISPPEVRGSLVALQQLAITFGIMISFWIDYGTNYIGGPGDTQKEAAWRIPLALQMVPAVILGVGILFMPFSPRWLINNGRDDEALAVLSKARGLPGDSDLVQIEFLEIKAQYLFEKETSEIRFPKYQDGSFRSDFKLGFFAYFSLLRERSNKLFYFRDFSVEVVLHRLALQSRRRQYDHTFYFIFTTNVGLLGLVMFFQQWTGINAILYYAPSIFVQLGLTGNTIGLLATGVVGIVMFLATIPAVIWVDQLGRRPVLISGAFLMALYVVCLPLGLRGSSSHSCHFIVAILTGLFHNSWLTHVAAGWVACVFVWIFAIGFGYSWGPCAWIIIAEIWPLSIRGKGVSIAASSNWMNNFIVGQVTPTMLTHLGFGTFVFFGAFSLMGGLFIMFFVPETKGVTLEEMEEVFGSTEGIAVEDQARLDAIHRRLGLFEDTPRDSKQDPEGNASDERISDSEKPKSD